MKRTNWLSLTFVCCVALLVTSVDATFRDTKTAHFDGKHVRRQTDPGATGDAPATTSTIAAQQLADEGPKPMETPMSDSTTPLQAAAIQNSTDGTSSQFGSNTNVNPDSNPQAKCDQIKVRRPWSKASREQRQAFLKAQYCLMHTPGKWNKSGRKSHSIWEDFSLLHNALNQLIHGSAILPPAHRVFINTMEWLMRSKCGYSGDYLYFDIWTYADQNEVWTSEDVWSEDYLGTFQGGGTPGFFKDQVVYYEADFDDDTIIRNVNRPLQKGLRTVSLQGQPFVDFLTTEYVNAVNEKDDYWEWEQLMESTFHQYQHVGHGGDTRPSTSPIAAWFWQIHSSVDAIWSMYQEKNNGKNRFSYGGRRRDGSQASTQDTIPMMQMWAVDFNVEDMLDTRTKPNCYSYEFTDGLTI